MEKIGKGDVSSYFDEAAEARIASNSKIRAGAGHPVATYFELAKKVAELQFINREYVMLFRGQHRDYRTTKGNSMLKPSLFRGKKLPTPKILEKRFERLISAEAGLVTGYYQQGFLGRDRIGRHRILRWAILQHYEVRPTPLLDATESFRIAASFATRITTPQRHLFSF